MSRSPQNWLTVVALGGNAILQREERGTFEEQYRNVRSTMSQIADLIADGRQIVITHGNGPQIGATLIRHEMAKPVVPPLPLHACGAETQGLLGYLLQQSLQDELIRRGEQKMVVTVVTQVLVDPGDAAFRNPSKPIGPFYTEDQKENLLKERKDLTVIEDSGRGYRRVVPSPDPKSVVESEAIRALVNRGAIVIACGGGGIPVIREDKKLVGVEAVIDKDLAGERLATSIGARQLAIMTDVEGVYLNYGGKSQRLLQKVTTKDLTNYAKKGHFASGSMGPKVEAVVRFLNNGGERAVVAQLGDIEGAIEGRAGTQITK